MIDIYYASDLHLEFSKGQLKIPEGDVCLLAGDICLPWVHNHKAMTGSTRNLTHKVDKRQKKFFQECSEKFEHVYYVLGNHEHYQGEFYKTHDKMREKLDVWACDNIHILENATAMLSDTVALFGATFWTDVRRADPLIQWDVECELNDYNLIFDDDGLPIKARLPISENSFSRKILTRFLDNLEDGVTPIILSHHAPFWESVPPCYRADNVSYAYANTNIERIFNIDSDLPSYWIHGHIHSESDYRIGGLNVLCHPRGYVGRETKPNAEYKFGHLKL